MPLILNQTESKNLITSFILGCSEKSCLLSEMKVIEQKLFGSAQDTEHIEGDSGIDLLFISETLLFKFLFKAKALVNSVSSKRLQFCYH